MNGIAKKVLGLVLTFTLVFSSVISPVAVATDIPEAAESTELAVNLTRLAQVYDAWRNATEEERLQAPYLDLLATLSGTERGMLEMLQAGMAVLTQAEDGTYTYKEISTDPLQADVAPNVNEPGIVEADDTVSTDPGFDAAPVDELPDVVDDQVAELDLLDSTIPDVDVPDIDIPETDIPEVGDVDAIVPDIPEIEEVLDEIPEIPEIEDVTDVIPEIPEIEDVTDEIPEIPEIPEIEDVTDEIPEIPEVEDVTDEIPEIPEVEDVTGEIPEIPEVAETEDGTDEIPEVPETEDVTDEIPEIPEVVENEDGTDEIPEVTETEDAADEIPVTEDVPDVIPDATETEDTTDETPEVTETEDVTEDVADEMPEANDTEDTAEETPDETADASETEAPSDEQEEDLTAEEEEKEEDASEADGDDLTEEENEGEALSDSEEHADEESETEEKQEEQASTEYVAAMLGVEKGDGETRGDGDDPVLYSVTYAFTGDVVPEGVSAPTDNNQYAAADSVKVVAAPPAEGYTFSGWKAEGVTIADDGTFAMPEHDVAFTGEWTIVEYTINFSYSVTVGSLPAGIKPDPETASVAAGEEFTLAVPTLDNYTFAGWSTTTAGVTISDNKFTMPSGDVAIIGTWKPNITLEVADGIVSIEPDWSEHRAAATITIKVAGTEASLPEGISAVISEIDNSVDGNEVFPLFMDDAKVLIKEGTGNEWKYTGGDVTVNNSTQVIVTGVSSLTSPYKTSFKVHLEGENSNYQIVTTGTLNGRAELTISKEDTLDGLSANSYDVTYDGKPHEGGYTFTIEKLKQYVDVAYVVPGSEDQTTDEAPSFTEAGVYQYKLKVSLKEGHHGHGNSWPKYITGKITINPAPLTVSFKSDDDSIVETRERNYNGESWDNIIANDDDFQVLVKNNETEIQPVLGEDYTVEFPTNVVNAKDYDVIITNLSSNFYLNDVTEDIGATKKLTIRIVPAKVVSVVLAYSQAGYNGTDWAEWLKESPERLKITAEIDGEERSLDPSDYGISGWISVKEYTVKPSENFTNEGTSVVYPTFNVVKAVIDDAGQALIANSDKKAMYDRGNWRQYIHAKGAAPAAVADDKHPDYEVRITAKYLQPDTGEMQDYELTSSEFELKGETEFTNASSEYKIQWDITSAHTADISVSIDKEIPFTVAQAQITDVALSYNTTVYDRHDWSENLKTVDQETGATFENILTVTTDPKAIGYYGEALTLNDNEYEIPTTELETAGTYSVPWTLKDTTNFMVDADKAAVGFTVEKNKITSVVLNQTTVEYDGADWAGTIGINKAPSSRREHSFYVTATTNDYEFKVGDKTYKVDSLTLNLNKDSNENEYNEISCRPGSIVAAGGHPVPIVLEDTTNFVFAEQTNPIQTEDSVYVPLTLTVLRYSALPIKDVTESTNAPSLETVVNYDGIYRFGPKQNPSARKLYLEGEPGEEVKVSIGGTTLTGTFDGKRFSNYDNRGANTGHLEISIDAAGVVNVGDDTYRLPENVDTDMVLAYADASNLKDGSQEKAPEVVTLKLHYDTKAPQIADAVQPFHNRDKDVNFKVPEPGRLDSMTFNEEAYLQNITYNDKPMQDYVTGSVSDIQTVNWNGAEPKKIKSGAGALRMKYTDLVGNESEASFDISQSTGAPLDITVEPILEERERINMDGGTSQIRIILRGTGWETIHVTVTPSSVGGASGDLTGSGSWAQNALGEYVLTINTKALPNDSSITVTVKYDDLIGSTSYEFFFDEKADELIMTTATITEDNWVIAGIAEPGSTVEVTVNGERVQNRKYDAYGVFTARQPQLEVGSTVRVVATDLSNNRAIQVLEVVESPLEGTQKLNAYAMGKVYSNAHYSPDNPEWMMVGYYTEEELLRGVKVPLVAANAFHIGTVEMAIEGESLSWNFIPMEGVTLTDQAVHVQSVATKGFSWKRFNEGISDDSEHIAGYWISAYATAEIPLEMLHNSFQLDSAQADIREIYFNRQRLHPLPVE